MKIKKITKKLIDSEISLENKNKEPFKTFRYKAKNQINFPLLFSKNAYVIYNTIKNEWTKEEIFEYIKENNLEIEKDRSDKNDEIITVCNDLRNKFFKTYPALIPWQESQKEFANKNGYIDSLVGFRRHLPYLLKKSNKLNKVKKEYYNGLENIVVNSPVQCISGESLILTDIGLFKIKELLEYQNKNIEFKIFNGESFEKGKIIFSGIKDTNCYFFNDGTSLISTEGHQYKRINENFNFDFIKGSDIDKDQNILGKFIEINNKEYQNVFIKTKYNGKQNINMYFIEKNINIDENIGWILGIMIGDGTFSEKECGAVFGFLKKDNSFKFRDILESIVNKKINIRTATKKKEYHKDLYTVYTSLFAFKDLLKKCGCKFVKAKEKQIPEIIWKSPISVMCSFIKGLFSSDGTCTNEGALSYTTTSKDLAYELANLLNIIKIKSSISFRGDGAFNVCVQADSNLFFEKVGLSGEYRNNKKEECFRKNRRKCPSVNIPFWLSKLIVKETNIKLNESLTVIKSRVLCKQKGLSKHTALRFVSNNFAYNFIKENEIKKIRKISYYGNIPTYDIIMEGKHQFWTNGIIVHNSVEALTIYKVMPKIDKEMIEKTKLSKMVLMTHDSLDFYVHKSELEIMYDIITRNMDDYTSFEIPLVSECSVGKILGFGKEIKSKDDLKEFL